MLLIIGNYQGPPSGKVDKDRRKPSSSVKTEEQDQQKHKKQRMSDSSEGGVTSEKSGDKLGSLIGRKRKERRAKKKS